MLPDINLIPKYERENSLPYILFISGLIICLLLFIALIFFYFHTKTNLADAQEQLNELNDEKMILEEKLASLDSDNETQSIKDVVTYLDKHIVPTSYLIDELLDQLPNNGYLSNFNYDYQSVEVETQLETMSDVASYVNNLNQSDFITDVQVNEMGTFELEEEGKDADMDDFYKNVPRYNINYSIDIDQESLRNESEHDE